MNSVLSMNEDISNILIFLPPIPPLEYFASCNHLWKEYTALFHPTQAKYILYIWKETGNGVTLGSIMSQRLKAGSRKTPATSMCSAEINHKLFRYFGTNCVEA